MIEIETRQRIAMHLPRVWRGWLWKGAENVASCSDQCYEYNKCWTDLKMRRALVIVRLWP